MTNKEIWDNLGSYNYGVDIKTNVKMWLAKKNAELERRLSNKHIYVWLSFSQIYITYKCSSVFSGLKCNCVFIGPFETYLVVFLWRVWMKRIVDASISFFAFYPIFLYFYLFSWVDAFVVFECNWIIFFRFYRTLHKRSPHI